ncbi:MAG: adenylosuccinate lyase, partial [Gammaproteobacteria bacterium]|nr:adenylosuccinate lyase [Gammaproteobacteria bacterium]
ALIRERIRIEALWLLHLAAAVPQLAGAKLTPAVNERVRQLAYAPETSAATAVKTLEASINHDVKAVEYYLREQLTAAGAGDATLELVHFGCTSEDINNLSYARLLQGARAALLPVLEARIHELTGLAHRYAETPMLARTHGQAASPTTLGKELANFAARFARARRRWAGVSIVGKWNGAVGNFNAHAAALRSVDWPQVARAFVSSLTIEYNPWTTQIEPHDWIGEYCDAVAATNVICIALCRDLWGYISLGYLRQHAVAGEVGSSTMPHKINPIDFENSEGNCGVANSLLRHFADKLPVSRWQRDLTDSTVLRNCGVALAHTLIAWHALGRGLARIEADAERMRLDLDSAWEVLAEAVQTELRVAGIPGGYERLKEFARGREVDATTLAALIEELPLAPEAKERLRRMRPADYIGLAAQLARSI